MALTLFMIGVAEMLIVTVWTALVSRTQVFASGIITIVNVFIWYYVLQVVVSDIGNLYFITTYALGCSAGTMIATYYFDYQKKAGKRARAQKKSARRDLNFLRAEQV